MAQFHTVPEELVGNNWQRAAWQVQQLAQELGIAISDATLNSCDMRDIHTIQQCLQYHLTHRTKRGTWLPGHHPCCNHAHALLQ